MSFSLEEMVALAKRRGIIYQGSEIYGGISGFWDYGPLGAEIKRNLKQIWWKQMVQLRGDVVGLDAAIIMNPAVWEASGHTASFTDPLVECRVCHKRFRVDRQEEQSAHQKTHHGKSGWTDPKQFNLLTEVYLGVTEPKERVYLRGEITQGAFVNFSNILNSNRVKIPFGIAQIGKAFRNEITPGNFTFRSREFEQMELEFFIKPVPHEAESWFRYWLEQREKWYLELGIQAEHLRFRQHADDERAHYARKAVDIEYHAPFGWSELEGIHDRGDWDLSRHKLTYKDPETQETYTPWVIETSGGVDRAILFLLLDSYRRNDQRTFLSLNPRLAPYKVAVFPLVANKTELRLQAWKIYEQLRMSLMAYWDERGNIGKRYLFQDEIGTPWCVTVDYQTLEDDMVTVRNRDTMRQVRVKISLLEKYFNQNLN